MSTTNNMNTRLFIDVNNPALTSPLVIDGACRATRKPG